MASPGLMHHARVTLGGGPGVRLVPGLGVAWAWCWSGLGLGRVPPGTGGVLVMGSDLRLFKVDIGRGGFQGSDLRLCGIVRLP